MQFLAAKGRDSDRAASATVAATQLPLQVTAAASAGTASRQLRQLCSAQSCCPAVGVAMVDQLETWW